MNVHSFGCLYSVSPFALMFVRLLDEKIVIRFRSEKILVFNICRFKLFCVLLLMIFYSHKYLEMDDNMMNQHNINLF